MRHHVSIFYARSEVPQEERNLFYSHMGHSEDINRNVYQCSIATATIMKVGRQLERLDNTDFRNFLLMCDEIQISKNVDLRVDTGKMVGFVDFGDNTTEEQTYQESRRGTTHWCSYFNLTWEAGFKQLDASALWQRHLLQF